MVSPCLMFDGLDTRICTLVANGATAFLLNGAALLRQFPSLDGNVRKILPRGGFLSPLTKRFTLPPRKAADAI